MQPATHEDAPGMIHPALATDVIQPIDQVYLLPQVLIQEEQKELANTSEADKWKKKDGEDAESSVVGRSSEIGIKMSSGLSYLKAMWMKKFIPESSVDDDDES
ncbi:hypothetical protein M422DRAFT_784200 [Sphaerobolus stellatus SS14]|uniref:Uncharacterized protein n=1 Tax=Sphaerobolus stellatus (strain SS14) TaxID=990650 RepID=A0A0C9ULT7_SPHS4|nr:hypothetical protein M422DRAFT_784200 [Sphaerobolus stellatus SS14]